MKVVVIGGTGLIGSKLVARLRRHGHSVVAASPATGVDTITGTGVIEAVEGADAVVDVSNSPSFEDSAVLEFFSASTRTLLDAARRTSVGHYLALSVVGTQRLTGSGYFRAKLAQEELISESGLPFTILHSTQFFEFASSIADSATVDGVVRLAHVGVQPVAGDDVAGVLTRISVGPPAHGIVEVGGPERQWLDDWVREGLAFERDERRVEPDPSATYFGTVLEEDTLLPAPHAILTSTRYAQWLPANPRPKR